MIDEGFFYLCVMILISLLVWQGEIESRALVFYAFGPDTAAMAMNDTGNRCQAYAATFKFVGVMQALKRAK